MFIREIDLMLSNCPSWHLKYNFRTISLININVKTLRKILANWIQEHIKTIICHYQVGFIPGMQGWFNIWKSINAIHYINKLKEKKPHCHFIGCWKSIWQNKASFHVKSLRQNRNSRPIPKYSKSKPVVNIKINGEKLEAIPLKSGTRQGCPLSISFQYTTWSSS